MGKQDIIAGEQKWLDAFNAGDASGVAQLYAHEARLLPPNADIAHGRMEIESVFKDYIQTGAKLEFQMLTVHESPDMCASVSRYTMDFPPDSGFPQDRGKFIELWMRQEDGTWLIAEDIFNSDLPVPEP